MNNDRAHIHQAHNVFIMMRALRKLQEKLQEVAEHLADPGHLTMYTAARDMRRIADQMLREAQAADTTARGLDKEVEREKQEREERRKEQA